MALASRMRVEQRGNAVIGTRNDLLYDEKTGLLAEKRTVVAQMPIQGGGTVLVREEKVQAVATKPPHYTAPRNALGLPVEDRNTASEKRDNEPLGSKMCPACGCLMCLVSIAIIIATASTGVLYCAPLHLAAVTAFIVASIICWMAFLCIFCGVKPDLDVFVFYLVGCCCVTLVVICFMAAVGINSFYVFDNISVVTDPMVDNSTNGTDCHFVGEPLGVAVLSYVLLILFLVFCCCAVVECLQSMAVNLT